MSEKHYVIAIKKGIDKDQIMDELKRDTSADSSVDSSTIPDRQVQQVNNRPSNKRPVSYTHLTLPTIYSV